MKVLCINASNKPNDILNKNWIVEGEEYTVLKLLKNTFTKEQYYSLAEIKPDAPYGGYKINRFAIHKDSVNEFLDMFKIPVETQEEILEAMLEKGVLEEENI